MTLLRALCALALLAFPASAAEFQIGRANELVDDAIWTCNEGLTHDGVEVGTAERQTACQNAIVLLIEISTNGYCYDEANDGWRKCDSGD